MSSFFGKLAPYRLKQIPALIGARERRKNYRAYPINSAGELYGEPLVDIAALGLEGRNYYNRLDNPPYYESISGSLSLLMVRQTVATKLKGVDDLLRADGLKLFLHDAFRPIDVQRYFHDVWMPAQVRAKQPGLSDADVIAQVEKYWAAPTVSVESPSPHATGGAIDLTVSIVASGEQLYMGSLFDDVSELAHSDYYELNAVAERYSDMEAQANRRLLYWVMIDAGFANNPNEWWHFSWGDQMWAKLTDEPAAYFGPVKQV